MMVWTLPQQHDIFTEPRSKFEHAGNVTPRASQQQITTFLKKSVFSFSFRVKIEESELLQK